MSLAVALDRADQTGRCLAAGLLQLALPDRPDGPPVGAELARDASIASSVSRDLFEPESAVGSRDAAAARAAVAVPEASVDEDDEPCVVDDDVGRAGERLDVAAMADAEPPQRGGEGELRRGVFRSHRPHDPAALRAGRLERGFFLRAFLVRCRTTPARGGRRRGFLGFGRAPLHARGWCVIIRGASSVRPRPL